MTSRPAAEPEKPQACLTGKTSPDAKSLYSIRIHVVVTHFSGRSGDVDK
jgi:hypothetical protein